MKKSTTPKNPGFILAVLSFIFYPTGVYSVWKKSFRPLWIRWAYTILGLPVFF
jgi:hypothetical protein